MAESVYLSGRLTYSSSSGWLVLEVPQALSDGMFAALREPGIDYAPGRAHIKVMSPDEVKRIGGPEKLSERGHQFTFTVSGLREVPVMGGQEGFSSCWAVACRSPALEKLRKSYGLEPRRAGGDFNLIFAVRYRGVLGSSEVKKADTESELRWLNRAQDALDYTRWPVTLTAMAAPFLKTLKAVPGVAGKAMAVGKLGAGMATSSVPFIAPALFPSLRDSPDLEQLSGEYRKAFGAGAMADALTSTLTGGRLGSLFPEFLSSVTPAAVQTGFRAVPGAAAAGRLLSRTPALWAVTAGAQNAGLIRKGFKGSVTDLDARNLALERQQRDQSGLGKKVWDTVFDPGRAMRQGVLRLVDPKNEIASAYIQADRLQDMEARASALSKLLNSSAEMREAYLALSRDTPRDTLEQKYLHAVAMAAIRAAGGSK